jgi:hypothetical protein
MKRMFVCGLAAIVITVAVGNRAGAQSQSSSSLGDYARAVKKTKDPVKPSGKVYDNDNLPNSSVSVVGQTSEPSADAGKDQGKDSGSKAKDADKAADGKTADGKTTDDKSAAEKKAAELKPGQAAEERDKALAAWKTQLDEQKSQISLLSRELDVLKREHDIKATEFNGDTARRVQNPSGFAIEDAKYKKEIAEKQKAVDAAKAKLDAMQEEARKSGAPNSVTE